MRFRLTARARLFAEAERVLKPGGKAVMFEHGNDFHNILIFGPVIAHVVKREEWFNDFKSHFVNVGYARTSHAVDLFWGEKSERKGTVSRALPPPPREMHANLWNWVVVGLFSLISLGVVAYLPSTQLVKIYWGIAFLGLLWPWMMIATAIAGDRVARSMMRPI